jgi:eukaryotic-like serine/threonine-protein kinase
MTLAAGARLGVYEIVAALGAGGMGEVYRARDTKLRREVAIKIMPETFAADPDRVARFQREAELLAALNHPNIAAIYGVEETAGASAIVMELVEGATLAEVIARGALPLDEALAIARQIADALEAAHERGIIHRDLKPANVKITADGNVKVLDFGLAKALAGSASVTADRGGLTMSPTLSVHATSAGIILGTAAYMSPEQARGKPLDRRADIWAFGCVLYEMLTGAQAFGGGDTVSDAVAAILRSDVDWPALPSATPPAILRLLRRCLEKDPRKRLPHVGVARLEIEEAAVAMPSASQQDVTVVPRERFAWMTVTLLLAALVVALGLLALRAPAVRDAGEIRVDIATPATTEPASFAVSPDGRNIVFVATGPTGSQLWLRTLDSMMARPSPRPKAHNSRSGRRTAARSRFSRRTV